MNFPHFDPEPIAVALFNLLQTAVGPTAPQYPFVTVDRRGQIPQNAPALNQPYLGLLELGGNQHLGSLSSVQLGTQGLEKWLLQFAVLIYIRADAAPTTVPATELNAAWLSIVTVLRSTPIGERQTLGGIVDNAYIFGDCIMNAGVIDQQCTLSIPVLVDLGL
jgi:hypothetical protein